MNLQAPADVQYKLLADLVRIHGGHSWNARAFDATLNMACKQRAVDWET